MPLSAPAELEDAWREIRADARRLAGESIFDTWLAPLQAESWDGATLTLRTPPATQAWVAERFGALLATCATRVLGGAVDVRFSGHRPARAPSPPVPTVQRTDHLPPAELELRLGFNPRYSFDQFVIGAGNRLAHAAALAVAENPGQAYNPLFIHAPPGLGKTHLLHAIGNYVLAYSGGASIRYTTVEAFTNNFVRALGSRSLDRFKHAYRDADVLLIDDVQFLASKARTEEEFFHTFNAVYETGRQLVLTCDRLPRELHGIEERLRERFESGLVANIAPPDHATRVAILRKRAALDRIAIDNPSVLDLVADRVTDNIRALEGALIRIVAYHSLTGRPIDPDLAAIVLDEIYPREATLTVGDVQAVVAAHFGLEEGELVSPSRAARIAWPRQIAMFLARELTPASLPAIGAAFGGRDHATVHYALRRVSERLATTPELADTLAELRRLLKQHEADRGR